MSWMSREHACSWFLQCCWFSTAAFFRSSLGGGLALLNRHPLTDFFLASLLYPWFQAISRHSHQEQNLLAYAIFLAFVSHDTVAMTEKSLYGNRGTGLLCICKINLHIPFLKLFDFVNLTKGSEVEQMVTPPIHTDFRRKGPCTLHVASIPRTVYFPSHVPPPPRTWWREIISAHGNICVPVNTSGLP
jgi:hypothetical protein